ncbi:Glucose/arabinose dehydrogenase, beta-propeller fold [Catalinimonas alkaloidigena]|uniref:Glucose/arabinose dehydrogenase, beta-propeller fold n=1 Tax=Catalinimonas alkaloidigena TaxID=1075417 RepID=A0A1G9HD74_9BACT|nr:plastocyanin/azurin family copper-binding protein [Catalinimonas alkaloidigena]SDL10795.1 Glucose/arabinose dehydrogenase, beta-propeller fold [Catalinimonas alkaloidigena]
MFSHKFLQAPSAWLRRCLGASLVALLAPAAVWAQASTDAAPPTEDDYYQMVTIPIPEGIELEGGGVVALPTGELAVSTRRGDVWIIENPYSTQSAPRYRKFASGLHEILGLAYVNGDLYMSQRGELTRLRDTDGDGKADEYETVYAWPLSGHYHEYSYGPVVMPDGSMIVTGNVAFGDVEWWRGESRVPWRGWALRITPDGKMEPFATGMRSPCGLGVVDGEFFYTDNQGDWQGSGFVSHIEKGDFVGHPAGLRWTSEPNSPLDLTTEELYAVVDPRLTPEGQNPIKPENDPNDKTTLFETARKIPEIKLPAVWLPHSILGISTSELKVDTTGGQFGPFEGQLFIGDQGQSKIDRVFLEKVKGEYQGAAFQFRDNFQSGVLRIAWGNDGSMFVGQTNRGWGSKGPEPYALQRLIWTGKTPFEMKAVRAMPDGFEIEFTQPVDKATAEDPASYQITGFIYKYHPVYGSPVINDSINPIQGVVVSADGLKARLVVDGLREKYVHEIKAEGVRSNGNLPLLHNTAYYTLNNIPEGAKLTLPERAKTAAAHADHAMMKEANMKKKAKATPAPEAKNTRSGAPMTRAAKNPVKKPAGWGKADQSIKVGTKPGLKYDVTELTVKAGSKVELTFSNNDDMPHNLVIVAPGQAVPVGEAAMALGLKGQGMNYVPDNEKVLYFTELQGPGASQTLYLVAPETPGEYTYVCTVPGHFYIMQGTLKVVK